MGKTEAQSTAAAYSTSLSIWSSGKSIAKWSPVQRDVLVARPRSPRC